jgi:hypothetical protein
VDTTTTSAVVIGSKLASIYATRILCGFVNSAAVIDAMPHLLADGSFRRKYDRPANT